MAMSCTLSGEGRNLSPSYPMEATIPPTLPAIRVPTSTLSLRLARQRLVHRLSLQGSTWNRLRIAMKSTASRGSSQPCVSLPSMSGVHWRGKSSTWWSCMTVWIRRGGWEWPRPRQAFYFHTCPPREASTTATPRPQALWGHPSLRTMGRCANGAAAAGPSGRLWRSQEAPRRTPSPRHPGAARRLEDVRLKVACRWRDCDTDLLHRSLSKHISGTHLKSTTVICSVDGCNERLSRGDA
ncbi:uncharacterized protein B0H18DRAFT_221997 [Fomitopsis serialis]|uniref:uncharacterized protein n=1 Tax=Fomitopsis serialis TaxID=139415 RepID=UPI0020082A96|nr:uncharacterized protein B0H18DRAFT_221997 [Neoantrodia serialis]KAH9929208.1 hypothetical protein B0H18DRAFT_221997 [Neoantrodia serialis]